MTFLKMFNMYYMNVYIQLQIIFMNNIKYVKNYVIKIHIQLNIVYVIMIN
jgi:hypothetical protein